MIIEEQLGNTQFVLHFSLHLQHILFSNIPTQPTRLQQDRQTDGILM